MKSVKDIPLRRAPIPRPSGKRGVHFFVSAEVANFLASRGVNLSQTCRQALETAAALLKQGTDNE